jgi:2-dehydro-3-deoxygalactonokinase
MNIPGHFLSCDWGTSSFRLRLVETTGSTVVAELRSEKGIRSIHDALPPGAGRSEKDVAFGGYLGAKLGELMANVSKELAVRHIMLSGMASSTIGWRELPYAPAPLQLDGSNVGHERIAFKTEGGHEVEVFLISGVCTERDIMRGEETEVVGILSQPRYAEHVGDSVIVLPGTHSKHLLVQDGRITDWQTFMTGELFEALTTATILKATTGVSAGDGEPMPGAGDAFREGAVEGFGRGAEVGIFRTRVRGVLDGTGNEANREYLSGLLIGSELRHAWQLGEGRPLLIAGPEALSARYRIALEDGANGLAQRTEDQPEIIGVDLPAGGAAILGHAFLLKRWLAEAESQKT